MALQTANYGLTTSVATDDFIDPSHHNKLADTLDRTLGSFLKKLIAQGAHSGWELGTDMLVSAGEGLVAGCWCTTETSAEIGGLQNGITNYVFAQTNATSADGGSVDFIAQASADGPVGAVYLGWLALDATGAVTALDNAVSGRQCFGLIYASVSGSGTVEAVAAGAEVTVEVDHAAARRFRIPGAITFSIGDSGFTWTVNDCSRADGFGVTAVNHGVSAADLQYEWQRVGISE